MIGRTPHPHILVANNPFGHHLLASQLLEAYAGMELDREVIALCNGVTPTARPEAFPLVTIVSYARFRIGAANHLVLLWMLIRLRWSRPGATYHLRGFVIGLIFWLSRFCVLSGSRYIYDPRGAFFIEWREAGRARWVSTAFRFVEARLIRNSLATIVTTERFETLYRRIFGQTEKYAVIYNSTSFLPNPDRVMDLHGDRIGLVYLGTFNHWHDLDEIHRVFDSATRQLGADRVEIAIYTPAKFHDRVRKRFADLDCAKLVVDYVTYQDIPIALSDKHIGISVVRPTLSTRIASPIKISDYIALGLIPLLNTGIGDFDRIFEAQNSAILYRFGQEVTVPDLGTIRIADNQAIFDQVSRQQSNIRLGRLVERLLHG